MRRSSVNDYAEAMRLRYEAANKAEKGRLLDEFTTMTGYHRKSAIRVLSGSSRAQKTAKVGRPKKYDAETVAALRRTWEAADRICGQRLAPFMGELVSKLQQWEELRVTEEVAEQLTQMSASTIDRLLRPYKDRGLRRPLSTTKPGSLLKAKIPIRTFAEWDDVRPGFMEVDLVAHCGDTTEGFYLNTLTAVDIATGWVACRAVWGKGQQRVGGAIHEVARTLPFPLLGLDSDNGSEFINHHLHTYCLNKQITFTRSRPYKKNDQAYVEQKNWTAVRRLIGYDRYSTRKALAQLAKVHRLSALYMNFFQPVMKLRHKSRNGARVRKTYYPAKTPYRRLLEFDLLSHDERDALERVYRNLNPVQLKRQLDAALEALWNTADLHPDRLRSVTATNDATYTPR